MDMVEVYKRGAKIAAQIVQHALKRGDVSRLVFFALSKQDVRHRTKNELAGIYEGTHEFISLVDSMQDASIRCYGDTNSRYRLVQLGNACRMLRLRREGACLHIDLLLNYSAEWDFAVRKLRTRSIPEIDAVIRTSGTQRLSGFLPLQSSYAELFFPSTLWPDFTTAEFDEVLTRVIHTKEDFKRRGGRGA